jgi:hypothetical protein
MHLPGTRNVSASLVDEHSAGAGQASCRLATTSRGAVGFDRLSERLKPTQGLVKARDDLHLLARAGDVVTASTVGPISYRLVECRTRLVSADRFEEVGLFHGGRGIVGARATHGSKGRLLRECLEVGW